MVLMVLINGTEIDGWENYVEAISCVLNQKQVKT